MSVGTAIKQAWNVLVILVLGLVYVAGLTVQTVIAHLTQTLSVLRPTVERGQPEPTERH